MEDELSVPAALAGRFVIEAPLGRGAHGAVFRARDAHSGSRVALKCVHGVGGADAMTLKNEFRVVSELAHPNVVQLFGLFVDDPWACVSMELVEGASLESIWSRGAPASDAARLASAVSALAGVVRGLHALHERGVVHRDVKPANVLVAPSGHVVLVDLGLAVSERTARTATNGGSPGWVAPERLAGAPASPASDLWAVGAMLHRALTGELPPEGGRASAQARGVSPELAALSQRLLDPDPSRRPDALEAMALLDAGRRPRATRPPAIAVAREPRAGELRFVGRERELERALAEFELARHAPGRAIAMVGPSGYGKTALASAACARFARAGAVVLRGRCDAREELPYRTADPLIDGIVGLVASDPELGAEMRAIDASDAARMFPALRSIAHVDEGAGAGADARALAVEQLAAILRAIAARRGPVVACVDDVQEADADSAALLRALLREHRALALLITTCREDGVSAPIARSYLELGTAEPIHVGPLDVDALERIVRALAPEADRSRVRRIALGAQGSALFAELLARSRGAEEEARDPDELLAIRIGALDPLAREILTLLASSTRGVSLDLALRSVRATGDVRAVLARLCGGRLAHATETPSGARAFEIHHPRIAEAALACASADERRRARAVLGSPDDPGALERSARRAESALAFQRAAQLWERALERAPSHATWRIREHIGEALAAAGDAAGTWRAFLDAAEDAAREAPAESRRLRRIAAEHALRAGARERGVDLMRDVLAERGVGWPSDARALAGVVVGSVARPRVARADRDLLDATWSAGVGLSLFDPIRGAYFHAVHADIARALGDKSHQSRSLATAAVLGGLTSGRADRDAQAAQLAVGRHMAFASGDVTSKLHAEVMAAAFAFLSHRDAAVLEIGDAAEDLLRASGRGGAWERANLRWFRLATLARAGRFDEAAAGLDRELARAKERGDEYGRILVPLGHPMVAWLARGEPERVEQACERALADGVLGGYLRSFASYSAVRAALYTGRAERALHIARSAHDAARWSGVLRFTQVALESLEQRALSALAVASDLPRHSPTRAALVAEARRDASRIERIDDDPARAIAAALASDAARLEGSTEEAARLAAEAALRFELLGRPWRAWAIRRAVRAGERAAAPPGVLDPDRFLRVVVAYVD